MNGTPDDIKELGKFVELGFIKLGGQVQNVQEKLTLIEKERAFESGFELKKKVEDNTECIKELIEWKLTANPTIVNSRRIIWGLLGAVGTLITGLVIALITFEMNRTR